MKTYSPEIEAQIAAGRIRRRGAIKFVLPSGSYGFVQGFRGKLDVEGVTFLGSGGVIDIDAPAANVDAAGNDMFVSLASHRRINGQVVKLFDPHLLASIEDEVWFRQPAIIYRFWFDANRALIETEQVYVRQIFTIEHIKSREGRRIRAKLSTAAAFARIAEAKISGPDLQRLIDPTDDGFRDVVATVSDPIYWGRQAPAPHR